MDKTNGTISLILNRILSKSKSMSSDLLSYLEGLSPTDFQSLLLEVFGRRVAKQSTKEIFRTYRDKYVYLGASELNQREIFEFGLFFFKVLPPHIQPIEFSPIGPLGVNNVLAKLSQNNVLSGIRNVEIISDPTMALCLETARRRGMMLAKNPKSEERVSICTDHRLLRLQPFDSTLGYMQHFRCFGICTAGRDVGHEIFLIESAIEHIKIYLDFIRVLNKNGFSIKNVTVLLSDMRILDRLIEHFSIDRNLVMRNAQNTDFKIFKRYGINIACVFDRISHSDANRFAGCDVKKNFELLEKVQEYVVDPLQQVYPEVHFAFDLGRTAGIGYYTDFCFHIFGENRNNLQLQLADGGLTDWTKKLLQSKKEMLMATGFGADLVQKMFRDITVP